MLNFCVIIGILGLIGVCIWNFVPEARESAIRLLNSLIDKIKNGRNAESEQNSVGESQPLSKSEQLFSLEPFGTITYLDDNGPIEGNVEAVILLKPLFQRNGSTRWEEKAEQGSLLIITDSFYLVNIPRQEGPKRVWLLAREVNGNYGSLRDFYIKGEDGQGDGPARKFRNNSQITPVSYIFPNSWGIFKNVVYQLVDIGGFSASVIVRDKQKSHTNDQKFYTNDFFAFVTSKTEDEKSWLLLLDPRSVPEDGYNTHGSGAFIEGKEIWDIDSMIEITPY